MTVMPKMMNNDDDNDGDDTNTTKTTINKVRDNPHLANGSYIAILSIMNDMNLNLIERCILRILFDKMTMLRIQMR